MNVGFFGDSYCDLQWFEEIEYRMYPEKWGRQYKPWCGKLLEDVKSPVLSSGVGGSCLYDSIEKWNLDKHKDLYNYVFWTFTWHQRLPSSMNYKPVFLAKAEKRPVPESTNPNIDFEEVEKAIDLFYKYLYDDSFQKFSYEQSLKWILNLPTQYPNIKFIFLPCTEDSRLQAIKHFDKGVLVNFSFETISNLETNSPGPMPILCGRTGHLNNNNHEAFAAAMFNIINDYNNLENSIVNLNLQNFDITTIPKFDY